MILLSLLFACTQADIAIAPAGNILDSCSGSWAEVSSPPPSLPGVSVFSGGLETVGADPTASLVGSRFTVDPDAGSGVWEQWASDGTSTCTREATWRLTQATARLEFPDSGAGGEGLIVVHVTEVDGVPRWMLRFTGQLDLEADWVEGVDTQVAELGLSTDWTEVGAGLEFIDPELLPPEVPTCDEMVCFYGLTVESPNQSQTVERGGVLYAP